MGTDHRDLQSEVGFPFIVKMKSACEYELQNPVNDILEMAIENHMDPLTTTMGMLYVELSEIAPSYAVMPKNKFDINKDADDLKIWMERILVNIPSETKSLIFSLAEDESIDNEDEKTYTISMRGYDSSDGDIESIVDSTRLFYQDYQSKTLESFHKNKPDYFDSTQKASLKQTEGKITFLEEVMIYGYCVLTLVKALKTVEPRLLRNQMGDELNIIYGIARENDFAPYQSIELTTSL